jgi:hypothetical protein
MIGFTMGAGTAGALSLYGVMQGALIGAATGAVSAGVNYSIKVAADPNAKWTLGEFGKSVGWGALGGALGGAAGAVGGALGQAVGGIGGTFARWGAEAGMRAANAALLSAAQTAGNGVHGDEVWKSAFIAGLGSSICSGVLPDFGGGGPAMTAVYQAATSIGMVYINNGLNQMFGRAKGGPEEDEVFEAYVEGCVSSTVGTIVSTLMTPLFSGKPTAEGSEEKRQQENDRAGTAQEKSAGGQADPLDRNSGDILSQTRTDDREAFVGKDDMPKDEIVKLLGREDVKKLFAGLYYKSRMHETFGYLNARENGGWLFVNRETGKLLFVPARQVQNRMSGSWELNFDPELIRDVDRSQWTLALNVHTHPDPNPSMSQSASIGLGDHFAWGLSGPEKYGECSVVIAQSETYVYRWSTTTQRMQPLWRFSSGEFRTQGMRTGVDVRTTVPASGTR